MKPSEVLSQAAEYVACSDDVEFACILIQNIGTVATSSHEDRFVLIRKCMGYLNLFQPTVSEMKCVAETYNRIFTEPFKDAGGTGYVWFRNYENKNGTEHRVMALCMAAAIAESEGL